MRWEGAAGGLGGGGRRCQENISKKNPLAAIFFSLPDIKKISENTSIRGVDDVFLACSVQRVLVQKRVYIYLRQN